MPVGKNIDYLRATTMYNGGYGGAISPELTNNPFINDPSNPHTRFPDISGTSPDPATAQFTSWLQPGVNSPSGQMQQPGMYQQPSYQQQQPLQYNPGYNSQAQGYASPTSNLSPQQTSQPFQPSSSFGQQLAGQIHGSSYGYLNSQGNGMPQGGYAPAQQQTQTNPGYLAQFDPYASIGQGWDGQNQTQNQATNQVRSPTQTSFSTSPSGNPHPREYIRTHKAELETWDTYAWKQALSAFDTLKDAWEARKKELDGKITQLQNQLQYGGGGLYAGQIQQEGSRLTGLLNEANSNFDSIAASSFQMREVFQGYRQSGDLASKRRVRESCNAALQGLPDWPPQMY